MAIQKIEQRMNEAQEILEQTHHFLASSSSIEKKEALRFLQNQKKLLAFAKRQLKVQTDMSQIDIACDLVTFGFIQQTVDFFSQSSEADFKFYVDKLVTLKTILERGRVVFNDVYNRFRITKNWLRPQSEEEMKSKMQVFLADFSAKIQQSEPETRANYLAFDVNKNVTDSVLYYSVASDMQEQIEAATTSDGLDLLFRGIIRGLSEKMNESTQWREFFEQLSTERCELNDDLGHGRISLSDAKCLMQQTHLLIEKLDEHPEQQAITDFFNNTLALRKDLKYLKIINGIINVALGIVAGATLGFIAGGLVGAAVGASIGGTVGIGTVHGGSRFMLWRRSDIISTQLATEYVDGIVTSAKRLVR